VPGFELGIANSAVVATRIAEILTVRIFGNYFLAYSSVLLICGAMLVDLVLFSAPEQVFSRSEWITGSTT
jgi:hypothetical protein